MSLSVENSKSRTEPEKREDSNGSGSTAKLRQPPVALVRDWPKFCGPFCPQNGEEADDHTSGDSKDVETDNSKEKRLLKEDAKNCRRVSAVRDYPLHCGPFGDPEEHRARESRRNSATLESNGDDSVQDFPEKN